MKKKGLLAVIAVVLVLACAIGGTLAWLTAQTDPVTNTFTVGNIDITLKETTEGYKMVPGNTIAKNPTVTVKGGSEACWLFVKVEESSNLDDFISYTIAEDWTALDGHDGVYYREVEAVTADTSFAVLTDNQVSVKKEVTKEMLGALTEATYPTLTFTAYAVQKDNIPTAADAWTQVNSTATTTP